MGIHHLHLFFGSLVEKMEEKETKKSLHFFSSYITTLTYQDLFHFTFIEQ